MSSQLHSRSKGCLPSLAPVQPWLLMVKPDLCNGERSRGTELMPGKATGGEGSSQTVQPWSKEMWEGNSSSAKERDE